MTNKDERTPIRERWTSRIAGGDEAIAGELFRAAATVSVGEKRLAEIHARLRVSARASRVRRPTWRFVVRLAFVVAIACFGGALSASVMRAIQRAPKTSSNGQESTVRAQVRRPAPHRMPQAAEPAAVEQPEAISAAALPVSIPSTPEPRREDSVAKAAEKTENNSQRSLRTGQRLAVRDVSASRAPVSMIGSAARSEQFPASAAQLGRPVTEPGLLAVEPSPPPAAALPFPATPPVSPKPVSPPPAEPSSLARESHLLATAIAALRQKDQPEGALRILDQYQAQFASGALAAEAAATRIEALLRLGRNDDALALLDSRALPPRGAARAMLVARAELREGKGRCAAALADFEAVLSTPATDLLAERALFGRATCRAAGADWARARRDFERYLAEYPRGRFAGEAKIGLEKIR